MNWLADLMTEMENDTEWDEAQKALETAQAEINAKIAKTQAEIEKWANKVYQDTKKCWTEQESGKKYTYKKLNETRRTRRIQLLTSDVERLQAKLKALSIDSFLD